MREIRFRRREFQGKLRRARRFERSAAPVKRLPLRDRIISSLGFRSRFGRLAAVFLLLLVAYFFTISRMFVIDTANEARAAETLQRLAGNRRYLVPKSHIAVLSRSALLSAIQQTNPEVRKITSFKKALPNLLNIELELRSSQYIWQSDNKYFLTDQDGTLYAVVPDYQQASTTAPLLIDRRGAPVAVGQSVSDSRLVPFLQELRQRWPRQIKDVRYRSFSVPAVGSPDVFVKTETGFSIYFDLGRSVQAQLASLALVLGREIDPATYIGLSYIDLRVPAYAYYCYLDAPCANATSTPDIIN